MTTPACETEPTALPSIKPEVLNELLESHLNLNTSEPLHCTQILEVFPGEGEALATAMTEELTPDPTKRGIIDFTTDHPIVELPEAQEELCIDFTTEPPTFEIDSLPVIPIEIKTLVLRQPYLARKHYCALAERLIISWSKSQVDEEGNPIPHNVIIVSGGNPSPWTIPPLKLHNQFHNASPDDLMVPEVAEVPDGEMWSQIAAIHPALPQQLLTESDNWKEAFLHYIETELLAHTNEPLDREWLPLVAMLGWFEESEVAAAYNNTRADRDQSEVRWRILKDTVTNPLGKSGSAVQLSWKSEQGGYVLNPRLAHILDVYYYIKDQDAWYETLHRAILMMEYLEQESQSYKSARVYHPLYAAQLQELKETKQRGRPVWRTQEDNDLDMTAENP